MDRMKGLFLLLLPILCSFASAQRISNTASYRQISSPKYFRVHYENDYFSTTDLYYTQGINLEYVHPAIGNIITSKLLIGSSYKQNKFGIAFEHEGFTPTSISRSEIQTGDRPFAACLFLKTFSIANNPERRERLSSSLSLGAIGPAAGGKQMQQTIHRWINDEQPQGWQHQIQNDVILNYQVEYERGLFGYENYFLTSLKAEARVGTLNTKANAGLIVMAGYFDDPFTNFQKQMRKMQLYVYAEPLLNMVGYDATLQGGLFNNSSPYVMPTADINRLVVQGNVGIVFRINAVQLEYFQSYLTKEFETGHTHLWGGVRIGWYVRE
jgi:lipid A 3-O-deacylase